MRSVNFLFIILITNLNQIKKNKLEIKENHLVKIIIDVKRGKSYYLDLIKKFDKTILLSRRNIKEQ